MLKAYKVVGPASDDRLFGEALKETIGMVSTDYTIDERDNSVKLHFNTPDYKNWWWYKKNWIEEGVIIDGVFVKNNMEEVKKAFRVVKCSDFDVSGDSRTKKMFQTIGMVSTDFEFLGDDVKLRFNTPEYKDWWYYSSHWLEEGYVRDDHFYPIKKTFARIIRDSKTHSFNKETMYRVKSYYSDSVILENIDTGVSQIVPVEDVFTFHNPKDFSWETRVISPPSELIKILENSGYTLQDDGWIKMEETNFLFPMLTYSGKEPSKEFKWKEEWLTKIPVENKIYYNQLLVDYMNYKKSLTTDAYFISKDKEDILNLDPEVAKKIVNDIQQSANNKNVFSSQCCPFCLIYHSCKSCNYGERHGVCGDEGSDYRTMIVNVNIDIRSKVYNWIKNNLEV